ncbi:MAG: transketolase [Candidatus Hydrogenedentota bacterium]|nr:MAG: transketolase [Candidatus Hydrogenedentota bacterium]
MPVDRSFLEKKADFVRRETLKIHKRAPETRLASSLSAVEILVVLYYGGFIKIDPSHFRSEERDRLIVSKAHGSVSLFPILADLGFFDEAELERVCRPGALLGSIPDPSVPGYETINGSLGHGLGVGCGMALGLKKKGKGNSVFVLLGDGELYEGAVWEAVMFAPQFHLDNLTAIVDANRTSMLDRCSHIIDLEPLEEKFRTFGWETAVIDGHNVEELHETFSRFKERTAGRPKVVVAGTIKGKGVPRLERDPLSHIRNLSPREIDALLADSL